MIQELQELKGKTVIKIKVSPDLSEIAFEVKEYRGVVYKYQALSDCCSESWFAHMTGVSNVIGAKVIDVSSIDFDLPVEHPEYKGIRQDVAKLHAIDLTTSKGNARIEFRNESNGYYDGYASLVHGSGISKLRHVTEDW